jgi:hypothetical protein
MPLTRWLAGIAFVAASLVAAGVAYAGVEILNIDFGRGGSAYQEKERRIFQAPNRDRLAVCVQNAGAVSNSDNAPSEDAAVASVEAALIEVQKHPLWPGMNKSGLPPLVEAGCDTKPAVYNPDPFFDSASPQTFFDTRGRRVSEASYFRLLVFILPTKEFERLSGQPPYRWTVEESLCSGDVCYEVTTGVYLNTEEADDVALIADSLKKAIGLELTY